MEHVASSGLLDLDYRLNVAALVRVKNKRNAGSSESHEPWEYLLCERADFQAWQCPQGGLESKDLCVRSGLIRELAEEVGLAPDRVRIVYESRYWRRYDFAENKVREDVGRAYRGQQQKWFLVEIDDLEDCDLAMSQGEFGRLSLHGVAGLLQLYAPWKASPFVDFLRELGLVSVDGHAVPTPDTMVLGFESRRPEVPR
jgi:8-oxo-dGTP pyrophosphatase MutT (NUDIX family)